MSEHGATSNETPLFNSCNRTWKLLGVSIWQNNKATSDEKAKSGVGGRSGSGGGGWKNRRGGRLGYYNSTHHECLNSLGWRERTATSTLSPVFSDTNGRTL